jgi:hypothetical protein
MVKVVKKEIPLCHRSKSAEIFIGNVRSKNFACSGAETFKEGTCRIEKQGLTAPTGIAGIPRVGEPLMELETK